MSIITTDYGLIKPPPGCTLDFGHPINNGLVGLWLFNEKSGTRLTDYSGYENHGTLTNMIPSNWVGSNMGGALSFDGSNDYVGCGTKNILNPLYQFTLSYWFKRSAGTKSHCGKYAGSFTDKGYLLQIFTDNNAYFVVSTAGGGDPYIWLSIPSSTNDKWTLLTGVWNSGVGTFYLNGVKQVPSGASGTYPSSVNQSTQPFEIQRYNAATYGNSQMDIVRLYNVALTPPQVMQLYSQPNIGIQSPTYYTPS